jgi:hypothetical protein
VHEGAALVGVRAYQGRAATRGCSSLVASLLRLRRPGAAEGNGGYPTGRYACGFSTTVDSGGSVILIEYGRPWLSLASAMMPGKLPTLLPP